MGTGRMVALICVVVASCVDDSRDLRSFESQLEGIIETCGCDGSMEPHSDGIPSTGVLRVLVILARFADDPDDPNPPAPWVPGRGFHDTHNFWIETAAQAQALMFDERYPAPGSDQTVNDWYRDASNDQLRVEGAVAGYYTLDVDVYPRPPTIAAILDDMLDAAVTAAAADGFPVIHTGPQSVQSDEFDVVVVAAPTVPGLSYTWGAISFGSVVHERILANYLTVHELGHSIGLSHAAGLSCGDASLGPPEECQIVTYGNPFSVMGGGRGHFNASAKRRLGWLSSTQVLEVTAPGLFSISPLEGPEGPKALRFPGEFGPPYSIEFRQPVQWDSVFLDPVAGLVGLPPDPFNGVFVIRDHEDLVDGTGTQIIDHTPGSIDHDFRDALVPIGSTFVDSVAGLSVEPTAIIGAGSDTNVTVEVRFSPIDLSVPAEVLLVPGESAHLSPQISGGTPPYNCQWSPVIGVDVPNSCNATLTPGDSRTYTVTVTDSAGGVPRAARVFTGVICTGPDVCAVGVPDGCEVFVDCNGDGVPDECQTQDCDHNGVADVLEVCGGQAPDCDGDLVLDVCELDCDESGQADVCEVMADPSIDADGDGRPDICGHLQGDHDLDGDIDHNDFAHFTLCFGGVIVDDCDDFDFDHDGDVDLVDFGEFQLRFTGPHG